MSKKIKVGIVGSGTMGNGIAHVFAIYGYSVSIVDISQKILDNAINTIGNNMQRQCNKNIISKDDMKNELNIIENKMIDIVAREELTKREVWK